MSEETMADVKADMEKIGMRCRWRMPEDVPEPRQALLVQWKGDLFDVLNMGILWTEAWETIGKKVLRWKYVE